MHKQGCNILCVCCIGVCGLLHSCGRLCEAPYMLVGANGFNLRF